MPNFCCFCPRTFECKSRCEAHELGHLPWFLGSIVCVTCQQRFDSEKRLSTHLATTLHKRKASTTLTVHLQDLRNGFVSNHRGTPPYKKLQSLAAGTVVTEDNCILPAASTTNCDTVSSQRESTLCVFDKGGASHCRADSELDSLNVTDFLEALDTFELPMDIDMSDSVRDPGTPIHDEAPPEQVFSPVSTADGLPPPPAGEPSASTAADVDPILQTADVPSTSGAPCIVTAETVSQGSAGPADPSILHQAWQSAHQYSTTALPVPPQSLQRAPHKRMKMGDELPNNASPPTPFVPPADLRGIQALLVASHGELVARINSLQDTANLTHTRTLQLETSLASMDQKLDNHLDVTQAYQHQLSQTLQGDIQKVLDHLSKLRDLGGKPPASLMQSIATLADEALQMYNSQ